MPESLFMSFEQWRAENQEVERSCREEVDPSCIECFDQFDARDDCEMCDGSGLRDDYSIDREVEQSMRLEYERQLSRDYVNAVRLFCAPELQAARGRA